VRKKKGKEGNKIKLRWDGGDMSQHGSMVKRSKLFCQKERKLKSSEDLRVVQKEEGKGEIDWLKFACLNMRLFKA
jgi:hypothetical protein